MAVKMWLGCVALGVALFQVPSAGAYEGSGWVPWESTGATASIRYDHSFAREWESHPPKGFPTISRDNLAPMKAAIEKYAAIVKAGGWPVVADQTLQPGMGGRAVDILRRRLTISGDLRSGSEGFFSGGYDTAVERAVKRFQASNGLTPTGIVDKRTIAALKVPADVRFKQLKTNLVRMQSLVRGLPKKYVVVNIPAAQIEAVENDRV
ncbi:MAG: peptidoglycan-binding protein, partial [Hyphomicrobiaceae bacterium]